MFPSSTFTRDIRLCFSISCLSFSIAFGIEFFDICIGGEMHFVSKTLAEQAAWKFSKENNIDFITIIPTLVIGPFLMPFMSPRLITRLSPLTGNASHYSIIKQG